MSTPVSTESKDCVQSCVKIWEKNKDTCYTYAHTITHTLSHTHTYTPCSNEVRIIQIYIYCTINTKRKLSHHVAHTGHFKMIKGHKYRYTVPSTCTWKENCL